MLQTFTVEYTPIGDGYRGQVVEWPEVVSEGPTLEACYGLLKEALYETIVAYVRLNKALPVAGLPAADCDP